MHQFLVGSVCAALLAQVGGLPARANESARAAAKAPSEGLVEATAGGRRFVLPAELTLELAAGPDLAARPVCADFGPDGRLYVAESSGSNDNVQAQLAAAPHRVLCLFDDDRDGRFDRRTAFAEGLMLPQGMLWHDDWVYVAAPPAIWRFRDADRDGVADQREIWFDGKTLTGCANDLHGPYAGRDGWLYWCKGAFAEQTYPRRRGGPLVTRAAHLFRRRPEGGPVEAVFAGGMDNPVEVVFTPAGETLLSATFLQHPAGGLRDGLLHVVYGGVYGKPHAVLDGHPRTGPLMPVLAHLGPAAPCGLAWLETDGLGGERRGTALTCCFNLRKVVCHRVLADGSGLRAEEQPLLASDDIDFHPTDVLEDADGSALVIDTGGWYKLCCPTSHLWKPDVLGAIYRLRRRDAVAVADPRGLALAWDRLGIDQLVGLLADGRPAVRRQAVRRLVDDPAAGAALHEAARVAADADVRREAVWALCQRPGEADRVGVRAALADPAPDVRQAALHACSAWCDAAARGPLEGILADGAPQHRRVAAEALGRIGRPESVPALLAAAEAAADRPLEHAVTYALIEIGAAAPVREGLAHASARVRRSALTALDQLGGDALSVADAAPLLDDPDAALRAAAWSAVERRPAWAGHAAAHLRTALEPSADRSAAALDPDSLADLARRLGQTASHPEIQRLLAQAVCDSGRADAVRRAALAAMEQAVRDRRVEAIPKDWSDAAASLLEDGGETWADAAIGLARRHPDVVHDALRAALGRAAADAARPAAQRVAALAAARLETPLDDAQVRLVAGHLGVDVAPQTRALALDALLATTLTAAQSPLAIAALADAGPQELRQLEARLRDVVPDEFQSEALRALARNPAAETLDPQALAAWETLRLDADARDALAGLAARSDQRIGEARQRVAALAAEADRGDPRAGLRVFHSSKAACATCHALGYAGGATGPDLTHIGRIRSPRDLAEAILLPSASFVRSYEPSVLVLDDGQVLAGIVRDENSQAVTLAVDAEKTLAVPLQRIVERRSSDVSLMPAGLDKVLSPQELRDLLALLAGAK